MHGKKHQKKRKKKNGIRPTRTEIIQQKKTKNKNGCHYSRLPAPPIELNENKQNITATQFREFRVTSW